jgi:general secretion pathway protein I
VRARGFTLVEVMVALAIVAIALPAVLMALYQQVDDTAYLRDKTLAAMVAANKLAEMRLVIGSTRTLTAGKDNGQATMADRDWFWWVETKATEQVPLYYRIEIRVALSEDPREQPLYTLTAFMSGDLQVDPQGLGGAPGDQNPDDPIPEPEPEPEPGQELEQDLSPEPEIPLDANLPPGLQLELPADGT